MYPSPSFALIYHFGQYWSFSLAIRVTQNPRLDRDWSFGFQGNNSNYVMGTYIPFSLSSMFSVHMQLADTLLRVRCALNINTTLGVH